jgi:hypothetical protein
MATKKASKKRRNKRRGAMPARSVASVEREVIQAPRKVARMRFFKRAKGFGAKAVKTVTGGDIVSTLAASVIAMGAARVTDSLVPDWVQAAALTVAGGVFYFAGKRRNIALALWGVAAYEATAYGLKLIDGWRAKMMDNSKSESTKEG